MHQRDWYSLPHEEVVAEFGTDPKLGLNEETVLASRAEYGSNQFAPPIRDTFFKRVLRQFGNPLAGVLLLAGVLTLLLREVADSIVIFAALLINVGIGLFQEGRANRAFEKLNASEEARAIVIRDGRKLNIRAEEVVRGDLIVLEAGFSVSADARIISANNLSINEAPLTGEWIPVSKEAEVVSDGVPLAERFNMAYRGTLTTGGYGVAIVVAIGDDTEVGKIAKALHGEEFRTPLQENLHRIARGLVAVVGGLILAIFALGIFRGEPLGEMLLIAIAIAVAAVPEGLPAAVTAVLAIGMERILRRGGLVKNLLAAETLGATTIILTDKTGTLTEARMELGSLFTLASHAQAPGDTLHPDSTRLLQIAVAASDAFIEEKNTPGEDGESLVIHGRPIEKAIIRAGLDSGIVRPGVSTQDGRLDFLHFESARRFGGALVAEGKTNRFFMTGAPEALLRDATRVYVNGAVAELTSADREHFEEMQERLSREGMRFIGVSYREVTWKKVPEESHASFTKDSIFVGLLGFRDPIRADVPEAIRTVQEAGATVIMLTGDNQETARSIAYAAGIIESDSAQSYTGEDIQAMDDQELLTALRSVRVFARVTPEEKLRIVGVLKDAGEVVAMTGDGINDAPALRSADIGVAVGTGTDVAKEASDLILKNNSFSILVSAIEEGRRIVDNLRKIFTYMLSTNFSSIFVIMGALIAATPLPILPTQLLWTNIVQGGLMNFAFAFEPAEGNVMRRKPFGRAGSGIMSAPLLRLILLTSVVTGSGLIALHLFLVNQGLPIEKIHTIMFVALSLGSVFFAFSIKSLGESLFAIRLWSNRFLLVALASSLLVLSLALFFAPLSSLLHLTDLALFEVGLLILFGLFNLCTIEVAKQIFFGGKRIVT